MSNTTDTAAQAVHGTNPQYLVEKITRLKIYNCTYWKEECFGLTAATIIDKAVALKYLSGTYGGNNKPSKFMCLLLKMLQLQPDHDIVLEFIRNDDFKYLRALGAMYLRLTGKAEEIYRYLEPLYNDYRPMIFRNVSGWSVTHMDEFIDSLLREEFMLDISLPFILKRIKLEEQNVLPPRKSAMEDELAELERLAEEEEEGDDEEAEENGDDDNVADHGSAVEEPRRTESSGGRDNVPAEDSSQNHAKDPLPDREETKSTSGHKHVQEEVSRGRSRSRSADKVDDRKESRSRHRSSPSPSRSRDDRKKKDNHSRRSDSRGSRSRTRERHHRSRDDDRYESRHRRDRSRDRRRSKSYSRSRSRSHDSEDRHHHRRDKRDKKKKDHKKRHRRDRDRYSSDDNSDSRSEDSRRQASRKRHSRDDSRSRRPSDRDDDRDSKRRREDDNREQRDDSRHRTSKPTEEPEEKLEAFSSKAAAPKKPVGEKVFDKIFGKKKPAGGESTNSGSRPANGGGNASDNVRGKVIVNDKGEKFVITASEGTVEYWNQMREALGMKKLRA
eukprot:gene7584-5450_t